MKNAEEVLDLGNYTFAKNIYFDIESLGGGQLTLNLAGNTSELAGSYAVVSRYNPQTKNWETMGRLARIDSNGYVTIEFASYSQIVLSVFKAEDERKVR